MTPAFAGSFLSFPARNPQLALWANDMPSASLTASPFPRSRFQRQKCAQVRPPSAFLCRLFDYSETRGDL